jgi:hypothetical protein
MRYDEHPPPTEVAAWVACLWTLRGDAPRRFVEHRLAELTRFFVDRQAAP